MLLCTLRQGMKTRLFHVLVKVLVMQEGESLIHARCRMSLPGFTETVTHILQYHIA